MRGKIYLKNQAHRASIWLLGSHKEAHQTPLKAREPPKNVWAGCIYV